MQKYTELAKQKWLQLKLWHKLSFFLLLALIYPLYTKLAPTPFTTNVTATAPISAPSTTLTATPAFLPPRVVSVPSYDTATMAANILNDAKDPDAATTFIALSKQRNNAQLQVSVAKLLTELKVEEAEYYEAAQRTNRAKEKQPRLINSTAPYPAIAGGGETSELQTTQLTGVPRNTAPRFSMLDRFRQEMTLIIDGQTYSPVRTGQTINGYAVGNIDLTLECVTLLKDDESLVVCLN